MVQSLSILLTTLLSSTIITALPLQSNATTVQTPPLKVRSAAATTYLQYATSAINAMQVQYYDQPNIGLWAGAWWPSANALTMIANLEERFPSTLSSFTGTVFPEVFSTAPGYGGFTNFLDGFYDDDLWWALAWIKVYDVTGNTTYLDQASVIFADAKAVYGTSPCGGMWWDRAQTTVNSIANELYMTTAAKLAIRSPSTPAPYYYLNEAIASYEWILNSTLRNAQGLFNDGLDLATCQNNGLPEWTYNQGVILSGLTELSWATGGDPQYNALAVSIANAAIANLADADGILQEPACGGTCGGDAAMFKGIFMRNLLWLVERANPPLADDALTAYKTFITNNADSIINTDDSSSNQLGSVWSKTMLANPPSMQSQTSGLDAIVAAACVA
ncbi:hypothetical protein B7494_g5177 [Chlorociboria aeruginascens]|nr:hypothetical protein B7494_g5177 [Chlorociboria aeruginascens]